MGVVRISDELHEEIKDWIKYNGNKYTHKTVTGFVDNAIFEKLKQAKLEK